MTQPVARTVERPRTTLLHRLQGAALFGTERARERLARGRPQRRPRVLVVTRLPAFPPRSGEHLRNWENIRAIGRIGEVDALSVFGRRPRPFGVPGLRAWGSLEAVRHYDDGWRPADRLGLTPVAFDSAVAGEFRTLLARRRPDAVVLEQLGQHVLIPLVHSAGAKVVLDNHNVEGSLAAALRDGSHAAVDDAMVAAVARAEGDAARAADAVWVCSDADATLMQERYGLERRPTVVPNVVDFVAYRTARARWRDRLLAPAPVAVFPAHFGYPPNEEAALILVRDVMPALREACPGARLVLAGRSPTEPMREHAGPGVEITGAVADIRPYLARATVMVMPLHRGSGTRFKAIEGFAAGLPVVSTAKGIEGLELEDGVHFLRAETPAAIVEAVRRLQADRGLALRIAREGYRLGLRRYSPAAVEAAIAASLRDLGLVDA